MTNHPLNSDFRDQIVLVGPGLGIEDFETGAYLQALLMFPRVPQVADRDRAFHALCAAFAAEQERSAPEYADWLRCHRPHYFNVPLKERRRVLRKLKTILEYRAIAGLMARAFVGRALLGDAYKLPSGLKKVLPSPVGAWVAAHHEVKSGDNIIQRAWRPSQPVLPLVIGLDAVFFEPGSESQSIWDKQIAPKREALDCQDMLTWQKAVELSHEAHRIVRRSPKISPREDIIRLAWCE